MYPVLVQIGLFWIQVLWGGGSTDNFLQLPCFFYSPNIIYNAFTTKRWSYENKRCISGGESNLFDLRGTSSQLNSMLYVHLSTYLPTYQTVLEWQYSSLWKERSLKCQAGSCCIVTIFWDEKEPGTFLILSFGSRFCGMFCQFQDEVAEMFQNYFLQVISE